MKRFFKFISELDWNPIYALTASILNILLAGYIIFLTGCTIIAII